MENNFFDSLIQFFNGSNVWVYLFIFLGKIAEVTIATLRIVLISRGERLIGTFVAIFEITLWILVTGTVLTGFQSDFYKVIVFVIAFAVGNFSGSLLEEKLAFGLCSLQVFLPSNDEAAQLAAKLREQGFGITTLEAKGMNEKKQVLLLTLKRKRANEAVEIIQNFTDHAVITISDVKSFKGGFMRNSAARPASITNFLKK